MSRDIYIEYTSPGCVATKIEIRAPYFIFGTQSSSKAFWSIRKLRELGITRLSELGKIDPIYFVDWDMLADLWRELTLLQMHLDSIDFDSELKAQWISHLTYCYFLLVQTAPKNSVPALTIG